MHDHAFAAGHSVVYCERDMDAWDVTAGQVILEEAGGRVTDFDGARIASAERTGVVASNAAVHDPLPNLLTGESC